MHSDQTSFVELTDGTVKIVGEIDLLTAPSLKRSPAVERLLDVTNSRSLLTSPAVPAGRAQ